MYDDVYDEDEWNYRRNRFADPYGVSALYRETPENPRNLPCPTCGTPNVLTPMDQKAGYQCDMCADALES
ncbi:MAG: hypothetical protein KatS3mg015_2488 [Fimbriimonadales bacterium]|nr:MAG: hypothetical protein KatS3mg015_2488 [Fimbriimonadales bacterium]